MKISSNIAFFPTESTQPFKKSNVEKNMVKAYKKKLGKTKHHKFQKLNAA